MATGFEWRQMEPFGAEVSGIDLAEDHPRERTRMLRDLFEQHHLLVFRNQKLTLEEQRRAAGWFGKLFPLEEGVHFISNARKDGFLGNAELRFHSDLAHCEYPIEGVMLHGIEFEGRTSTKFVDITKAWETLPDDIKAKVVDRRATQAFAPYGAVGLPYEIDERLPHWSHRVARPHPRTGELCLYVMAESTRNIEGLPEAEGRPLIETMCEHVSRADGVYEHFWSVGDVVIWDNLACQHARGALNPELRRTMQRATIGALTFKQQYPRLDPAALELITGHLGAEPG